MKVIVTGAKGQIGSEVVLAFEQQGHQVIACSSQDLDITQDVQVAAFMAQHQDCEFIINCAAYTAVDKAETEFDKAYAVNALGVKNLAVHAKANNIALIHLSTDYVFDGRKVGAYTEEDQTDPLNLYGKTKLQGENFLRETWEQHIILRVSWAFSYFGHNFVKTMLRLFAERSELNVVNDQRGCPTGARDLAVAIIKMCEYNLHHKPHWGIYNYCGQPVTTWYDFAIKIYELSFGKLFTKSCRINPIPTTAYPTPALRPKNSELSTNKIVRDFDIELVSWEERLKAVLVELEKK